MKSATEYFPRSLLGFFRGDGFVRVNPNRRRLVSADHVEVLLRGGIGNQLFGYALGRELASKNSTRLHLVFHGQTSRDSGPPLRFFELDELTGSNVTWGSSSSSRTVYRERSFRWDSRVSRIRPGVLLDGYFQTSRYFLESRAEVVQSIRGSKSFREGRASVVGPFIALQVRRGDYLRQSAKMVHGVVPEEYFQRSVNLLRKISGDLPVVIFSDDFRAAESLSSSIENSRPHVPPSGASGLEILGSLSGAAALCISNSSFGWWGGFLAESGTPVVAPRPWFSDALLCSKDLVESHWLSLGFTDFSGYSAPTSLKLGDSE